MNAIEKINKPDLVEHHIQIYPKLPDLKILDGDLQYVFLVNLRT